MWAARNYKERRKNPVEEMKSQGASAFSIFLSLISFFPWMNTVMLKRFLQTRQDLGFGFVDPLFLLCHSEHFYSQLTHFSWVPSLSLITFRNSQTCSRRKEGFEMTWNGQMLAIGGKMVPGKEERCFPAKYEKVYLLADRGPPSVPPARKMMWSMPFFSIVFLFSFLFSSSVSFF